MSGRYHGSPREIRFGSVGNFLSLRLGRAHLEPHAGLRSGKLHQPRQFGAYAPRRSEIWLETVLPNDELDKNPAAKKAWDQFQTVAGLTNVKLDRDYQ